MLALGVWGTLGPHCHPHSPTRAEGWAFTGSAFQVWVIANKVQGSHGLSRGTVCHRTGVQPREPKGQGWDYGIGVSGACERRPSRPGVAWSCCVLWDPVLGCTGGPRWSPSGVWKHGLSPWPPAATADKALSFQGGWDHITVRANATRAFRSRSQETATDWSGEPGLPSTPSRVAGASQEARGPVCC